MRAIHLFGWLLFVCNWATVSAQSQTSWQPSSYGGQIVHEIVPFQPPILCEPDACGELVFSNQLPQLPVYDPYASDSYATQISGGSVSRAAGSSDRRKGCFQKVFASGTYIPQFEEDALGLGELEAGLVLGIPFFRVTAPLLITPKFGVHFLDRPTGLDLPQELYDAEVTFRHLRKFGEGPWAMNAAVTLGHYSDFEASDADAFRVTGQAFAVYEWSPATTWVMGAVYLNREDVSVIPALGFIYQPHSELKIEALFPRPKVAWRLPGGLLRGSGEHWAYVGGELGGGVWSIDRSTTVGQDLMTYNDYRLLVGIEKKAPIGGVSHQLELGYVFRRELEFASATPDVRLDDSLFVRLGVKY